MAHSKHRRVMVSSSSRYAFGVNICFLSARPKMIFMRLRADSRGSGSGDKASCSRTNAPWT